MRGVAQVGHARVLGGQEGVRIGAGDVGLVAAFLAAEIHLRVAPLVGARRLIRAIPRRQALVRGPGPQERAIDAEVMPLYTTHFAFFRHKTR